MLILSLPTLVGIPTLSGAIAGDPGAGLLGWAWGTPLEAVQQRLALDLLPGEEPAVLRYRTGISALGEVALCECDFEFVRGRLAGVLITTRGRENSRALLQALRRLYGPGHEEDPRGFGWLNATCHAHSDEDSAGDAYVYVYALRFYQHPPAGTAAGSD
jgi:hypothetical protein